MTVKQWLRAFGLSFVLWTAILLCFVAAGQAKVGVAHGFGPHLSNPLTPHIGRVYYKPGDRATRELSPSNDERTLDQIINELEGVHKLKCDKEHADYVARHGVSTPRPLKGYHGCAKYARDEGYWKTRRGERVSVPTPASFATNGLHNAVVDSVPYQVSGIFSLTNWNKI